MGIAVGDPFLSGHPSLYVTNFSGETNTLYRNVEGQLFDDATEETNSGAASYPFVQWGTGFEDFDDDGYPDLYAVSGHIGRRLLAVVSKLLGYGMKEQVWEGNRTYRQPACLWRNAGNGVFEDAAATSGDFGRLRVCARGSAAADFDGDGRVDIAVAAISGGSRLLRNTAASPAHAIEILPVAGTDRRTCLGTKVRVTAGGRTQTREFIVAPSYASGSWVPLHFGLGNAPKADSVEVIPPGKTAAAAVFRDVAADRLYRVRGEKLAEVRAFRR
jgi:hypothetical protein